MPRRGFQAGVCASSLLLFAFSAGCRDDVAGPAARLIPPRVTTPAPPGPRGVDQASPGRASGPAGQTTDGNPADVEPPAGNPFGGCDMCHVDCADELALGVHYGEKIGCVDCHGKSEGHAADENNEVKPDRLFGTVAETDEFCGSCHECPRPQDAKPPPGSDVQQQGCIACHHAHTLAPADKGTHD